MLSKKYFEKISKTLKDNYPDNYAESTKFEKKVRPKSAIAFAEEVIYVICASGFRASTAAEISDKCINALKNGRSSRTTFKHKGKTRAIDAVWRDRDHYFREFKLAADADWFETLPFIGPITKNHLAKNCGMDVCKDDIWLNRLSRAYGTTAEKLCAHVAKKTDLRKATVDSILWEACRNGLLDVKSGKLKAKFA